MERGQWCSLAFHSHRGFSPVIGRPGCNPSSRFNGFHKLRKKPLKRFFISKNLCSPTGLKPRCE